MIVTIDEARVGHPSIKLDGMELELLPGTDLAEVKVILDNPLVNISVPAVMEETTVDPAEPNT